MFAGVAGDLSPLTIEASAGTPRAAPPALVVAIAVGLGTVDMPWPAIAEWEWLNWKFPRPVHAGDTIYARWTLTQKRPPASGATSSIVVWRVDVHTTDGAMCAEGEIGAKVKRHTKQRPEAAAAAPPAAAPRRRRRRSRGSGTSPEPAPVVAPPAAAAKRERAAGPSRRRRRRRSPSGGRAEEDHEPRAANAAETAAPTVTASPAPAGSARGEDRGTIGRVLKRLRGS